MIGNIGFSARKFRPHLANFLEFGLYLEASLYGPSRLKGMISLSIKVNEMPLKPNRLSGKSSLSMLESHGMLLVNMQIEPSHMMMRLRIMTKFGVVKELLCHQDPMHWHIRAPNVG